MTHRVPGLRIAAVAWLVAGVACAPARDANPRADLDQAVARFVAGDYAAAIERLNAFVDADRDEAFRGEAYTYLGRAHMALGETDQAVEAFTLGARYPGGGPCIDYLETLKQYVEGSPEGLHLNETVTRGQLAGAIIRLLGDGEPAGDPNGPTPLARLEARGWMVRMADGNDHAADPVTVAALYVTARRILFDVPAAKIARDVMPGGYRAALDEARPVSGREAIAVLERVRELKENHGR
jgi:tetratricopeptide (TPR) repeat protein